jgi:uncharacterized membrane protein YidH (DUF202 family)
VSYTYTQEEERHIYRDALTFWLYAINLVLVITVVTLAVCAIMGARA